MSERPPISQVVDDYDQIIDEIREVVAAEDPAATWFQDGESRQSSGESDDTVRVLSPIWASEILLAKDPDARDRVVAAADEVLAKHDFAKFSEVNVTDEQFSYVAGDAWGAEIHFGGEQLVTLRYVTGSHPEG